MLLQDCICTSPGPRATVTEGKEQTLKIHLVGRHLQRGLSAAVRLHFYKVDAL